MNIDEHKQLTKDVLEDLLCTYEELKKDLTIVVGFTLNQSAYKALKAKFTKIEDNKAFQMHGIECYVVEKQQDECIAWYNLDVMRTWIAASKSDFITELPIMESKGSA